MKNSVAFDDKRLLGVLDGVDEKFIAEALEYYDLAEPAKMRKAPFYRKIAAIAASLVLLAFAMPIFSYIVPQIGELFGGDAGNTGDSETVDLSEFADVSERDLIEHIGEVPAEFIDIVEQNLFANIKVSGSKIIKPASEPYDIEVYDFYGELLHRIEIKGDVPEYIPFWHKIHSLSDGTYLYVIPRRNYYRITDGTREDITEYARVIRFDEKGNILFNTKLDITDTICEFEFFYETEDAYLLIAGSYQKSDSYFVKLDKSGKILKNIQMGGNESDRLYWVYYTEDGKLTAYMREHTLSAKSGDTLKVTMDENFNILDYCSTASPIYPLFRQLPSGGWNVRNFVLGYNPGHKDDPELPTWGSVSSVIEYDDFVLIISERNTKMFPYLPMIESSHYYYSETVYTAHALDGTILWRTAVDSTNYTLLAEVKQKCEDERKQMDEWLNEQSTEE